MQQSPLPTPEPLHPDLALRLVALSFSEELMVKHPLLFDISYHESKNPYLNALYLSKRERAKEAGEAGDWHRYVHLHERPFRVDAFLEIAHKLNDSEYWDFVRKLWLTGENAWEIPEHWERLWNAQRTGRSQSMMTEDELTFLNAQTEPLMIYRGFLEKGGQNGLSWTLDLGQAKWFAKRLSVGQGSCYVATGRVSARDVRAYFKSNGEEEIVVDPAKPVEILKISRLKARE
jgi:hypothetical protein